MQGVLEGFATRRLTTCKLTYCECVNINQKPANKKKKFIFLVHGSSASCPLQGGYRRELVQLVISGIDNTVLNGRVNAVDARGFGLKFVISITSGSEIVGKVLSYVVYKAI